MEVDLSSYKALALRKRVMARPAGAPQGLSVQHFIVSRVLLSQWRAEADETENYTYAIPLQNET